MKTDRWLGALLFISSFALLGGLLGSCTDDEPNIGARKEVLSACDASTCSEVSVAANADTYIKGGQKNQNFGLDNIVRVQGSGDNRILVAFDPVEVIAAAGGETILGARLELALTEAASSWTQSGGEISIHRTAKGWLEEQATWNCAIDSNPSNSSPDCSGTTEWDQYTLGDAFIATATDEVHVNTGDTGTLSFDVSADVGDLVAGNIPGDGWLLRLSDSTGQGSAVFSSRQGTVAPKLVLVLDGPSPSDAGAADASSTLLQTITAGEDSFAQQGSPNQNQDGLDYTQVKVSGRNTALVRFDAATIAQAKSDYPGARFELVMSIKANANNWGGGEPISVHQVWKDWTAPAVTWNCPIDTDLSNSAPDCAGSEWDLWSWDPSEQGFDISSTDSKIITNGLTGTVRFDVTQDIDDFTAASGPEANYGWVIRNAQNSTSGRIEFWSFESANPPVIEVVGAGPPSDAGAPDASPDAGPGCTPTAGDDTTCDGIDDDCDGNVDEDYAPESTSCGVGACGATGTTSCVDGTVEDSCTPGTPAASDATCDGIDDNCDGTADEGYVSQSTSCGVGACGATGTHAHARPQRA